jgi:hypothetical protein
MIHPCFGNWEASIFLYYGMAFHECSCFFSDSLLLFFADQHWHEKKLQEAIKCTRDRAVHCIARETTTRIRWSMKITTVEPSLARTCVILRLFAPLCLQSHRSWRFLVEIFSILVTAFLLVPFGFLFLLLISYFFFWFSIVFSRRPVLARKSAPRSTQSAALCQSLCVLLVCSP